jgi:hypothetical protein
MNARNAAFLRPALVLRTHPEHQTADIMFLEDGWRVPGVPVMSPSLSSQSGWHDLPAETVEIDEKRGDIPDGLYLYCVVGLMRGAPVILGFLPPSRNETCFKNRFMHRLASDVYLTVDGDGNLELFHPSGSYFRLAETPGHEDLAGQDEQGRWEIRNNTQRAPHIMLQVAHGGSTRFTFHITPAGELSVSTEEPISIHAGGGALLDTPLLYCTGDVQVDGDVQANGDVRAGSVSLRKHVHNGVKRGGSYTSRPT